MTDEQYESFLARAEQLGHSRTELQKRGTQRSTVTVHTIEDVRKLLRVTDPKVCEAREKDIEAAASGRERNFKERLESYFHGTGDLTTKDLKEAEKGLPMTVVIESLDDKTMPHGQTIIGPSANPTVWNLGTLNFYSDSYLTVENTYFSLHVQVLNMQYSGA